MGGPAHPHEDPTPQSSSPDTKQAAKNFTPQNEVANDGTNPNTTRSPVQDSAEGTSPVDATQQNNAPSSAAQTFQEEGIAWLALILGVLAGFWFGVFAFLLLICIDNKRKMKSTAIGVFIGFVIEVVVLLTLYFTSRNS